MTIRRSAGLGSYQPTDYNTLKSTGNFTPADQLTYVVDRYQSMKTTWFMQWNMNGFDGRFFPDLQYGPGRQLVQGTPPPPDTFDCLNVDVAAWAEAAKARNVNCFVISVFNEWGWCLWPSEVRMPPKQPNGYPMYDYYGPVTGVGDQRILEKVISEFGSRGITVGFYINIGFGFNLHNTALRQEHLGESYRDSVVDYHCKITQELILKYRPQLMWYDTDMITDGRMQKLYNAVKAVDPGVLMLGNTAGDPGLNNFPYDMDSTEEYALFAGNTTYRNNYLQKNGTTYYVGHELIAMPFIFPSDKASYWYWLRSDKPGTGVPYPRQFQYAPTFQNLINQARLFQRPISIDIQADLNGVILQDMLDYYDTLNFS